MQYQLNITISADAAGSPAGDTRTTTGLSSALRTEGHGADMKLNGITTALLFGAAALLSSGANADCACLCVDGNMKTLCSSVEEAQANPTLCDLSSPMACPSDFRGPEGATYDSPHDEATNCRDLRVYDPARGDFVSVKACDVLNAG